MAAELKESRAKINLYQRELEERIDTERAANARLVQQILEHETSEKNLLESEERYRQLAELSPDAICIENGGKLVYANRACAELLGAGHGDIVGRPGIDFIHPDFLEAVEERRRDAKESKNSTLFLEVKLVKLDGTDVDVELVAGPFFYQGKLSIQWLMRDITNRRNTEQRLTYLAQYDTLTGLPNRNLFRDRLAFAIARMHRSNNKLALLFLDLDRFKEINDSHGHTIGDEVLQVVANSLKEALRDVDTIARMGGDEFAIILDNIQGAEQVSAIAERIRTTLSTPFLVQGVEIFVSASMGIAIYPRHGATMEDLIQSADVAMYRAKEEGRNTYIFFSSEMNSQAAKHLNMANLLRHGLDRNEFLLHYQPKVAIPGGDITGMEALVRWNSTDLGFVMPGDFISLAEATGLIVQIGAWVLRTACMQNKAWQVEGWASLVVAVNLSARQFQQKDLVEMISTVLAETGLEPRFLELEITESMIMHDAERAVIVLESLSRLGVQLSIDDFGTGYSSLAYLKKFPVQKLKIDQSFVRDLAIDTQDAGIVKAIIAMAKSLKLGVIAEGVETAEQLKYLTKLRCDEYQGYYFSKPVPATEFVAMLRNQKKPPLIII
jgi:diguanylate cyclase (GGDEF)-like protein/PAS domain S-box-containing protein